MMASRDPKAALDYVATQVPEKDQNDSYSRVFQRWMGEDRDESFKWLATQSPERQIASLNETRWQMRDWSYEEFDKRATGLDPKAAQKLWYSGLEGAADREPEKALTYLPKVSEADRPNAYATIARGWTKDDPAAASVWVDQLPPGREKDRAISGMASQLSDREPDSSTIWAATIADEKERTTAIQSSAAKWLKRDRPTAEAWIQESTVLDDAAKQSLLAK
jgi:hypothetical protein